MLSVFDTCSIILPKAIPTSPDQVSAWKIRLPHCHFDLAKFPKATTPHIIYERTFNGLLSVRFQGFKRIYADRSKSAKIQEACSYDKDCVTDLTFCKDQRTCMCKPGYEPLASKDGCQATEGAQCDTDSDCSGLGNLANSECKQNLCKCRDTFVPSYQQESVPGE
uniref:EGF-like domain-containing protein n=1 Tax=Timema cristinae TaxID=61476 RepID=A0A7R9H8H0_TIMCR|nr:unnamed protein product [Timema cristinae]